jgi:hypothetical protein
MSIKIEPEETTEARTHNLRRRMGCPTPKCENGKMNKKEKINKNKYLLIKWTLKQLLCTSPLKYKILISLCLCSHN